MAYIRLSSILLSFGNGVYPPIGLIAPVAPVAPKRANALTINKLPSFARGTNYQLAGVAKGSAKWP